MHRGILAGLLLVGGCAVVPERYTDMSRIGSRLGIAPESVVVAQDCIFGLALVGDKTANFAPRAICVVLPDRFIILRSRSSDDPSQPPLILPYTMLEAAAVAVHVKRTQLHLKTAVQLVVVEMEEGLRVDSTAHDLAIGVIRKAGVPSFNAVAVLPRLQAPVFIPIPIR